VVVPSKVGRRFLLDIELIPYATRKGEQRQRSLSQTQTQPKPRSVSKRFQNSGVHSRISSNTDTARAMYTLRPPVPLRYDSQVFTASTARKHDKETLYSNRVVGYRLAVPIVSLKLSFALSSDSKGRLSESIRALTRNVELFSQAHSY